MKEQADVKIEWWDIQDVSPAPWNPPSRTTDRAVSKLVQSMRQKEGFWAWEPIQVAMDEISKRMVAADGNRRLRAAQIVGFNKVPVIVLEMSAQEYWARKNGTMRATSVRETSQAIALGLTHIPPAHERTINGLLVVYGGDWSKVRELFATGVSASVISNAQRIANYCGFHGDDEFVVRAIDWLAKYKMGLTASRAIADGVSPDIILTKITNDEPIRTGYN